MEVWRLTDQEIACIEEVDGGGINEAQKRKKEAYIKAGGVILNPDALVALYEALKRLVNTYIVNPGTKNEFVSLMEIGVPPEWENARKALAKAES